MTIDHLAAVDAEQWPAVAAVPEGLTVRARARIAEARFALACAKAGVELDPKAEPDLVVERDEFFRRIAVAGWTGIAESYMAGEWRCTNLPQVLSKLISAGFDPMSTPRIKPLPTGVGELSPELVALYSGDGMSSSVGLFSSGVSTTVREQVPSFVSNAGKGNEPARHFVDVTTVEPPVEVEREDLSESQGRAIGALLDAAGVRAGTHVLELPSSGGAVAIEAARRRATVDCLTGDVAFSSVIKERLTLAGVADSVHTVVRDSVLDGARDWRARYDAVVCLERLETLAPDQRRAFLRGIDRMLSNGGDAALQSLVATDAMTSAARASCQVMRHYIWPGLDFFTMNDLHKLVDRATGLRVVAVSHFGEHARLSLGLQRENLETRSREAAAEGFDAVYRRLWKYQLALREALLGLGMLDAVTVTMTHRHRRSR